MSESVVNLEHLDIPKTDMPKYIFYIVLAIVGIIIFYLIWKYLTNNFTVVI